MEKDNIFDYDKKDKRLMKALNDLAEIILKYKKECGERMLKWTEENQEKFNNFKIKFKNCL